MHARDDLGCDRGYEGWLAKEAKARNPAIKVWSLSWGVPGWVGEVGNQTTGSYFSADNIDYQIAWLNCLKDTWGVDSDYIGLWNERCVWCVYTYVCMCAALLCATPVLLQYAWRGVWHGLPPCTGLWVYIQHVRVHVSV